MTEKEALERYNDFIDETHGGTVKVAGVEWDAHRVLRELDPTAYRTGFHDWADSQGIDTDELEA